MFKHTLSFFVLGRPSKWMKVVLALLCCLTPIHAKALGRASIPITQNLSDLAEDPGLVLKLRFEKSMKGSEYPYQTEPGSPLFYKILDLEESIIFQMIPQSLHQRIVQQLESRHIPVYRFSGINYSYFYGAVAIPAAEARQFLEVITEIQRESQVRVPSKLFEGLIKDLIKHSYLDVGFSTEIKLHKTAQDLEDEALLLHSSSRAYEIARGYLERGLKKSALDWLINAYAFGCPSEREAMNQKIAEEFQGHKFKLKGVKLFFQDSDVIEAIQKFNLISEIEIEDYDMNSVVMLKIEKFLTLNESVKVFRVISRSRISPQFTDRALSRLSRVLNPGVRIEHICVSKSG